MPVTNCRYVTSRWSRIVQGPNEFFEDVTVSLNQPSLPIPPDPPGLTKVIKIGKSYLPGSMNFFFNGLLQRQDWFYELDPRNGLIGFFDNLYQDVSKDQTLTVVYLSTTVIYVDPNAPVHISQIRDGDVLRIAMKAGKHLEPRPSRKGLQHRLEVVEKPHTAKGMSMTVFLGNVTGNDTRAGILSLQVNYRSWGGDLFAATVPYAAIKVVRKYITPAIPQVRRVNIGGGPGVVRRPGILGMGFCDSAGFMNLVQVRF